MKRRAFIAGAGAVLGAACAPSVPEADDVAAVKRAIEDVYSVYYRDRDKQKYRALLTDDYMLLEKGKIFDADADVSLMPAPGSDYKRTDSFDFRSVKCHGDIAYVAYFLKSEIVDNEHVVHNDAWLESVILQRFSNVWRVALFHSTLVPKTT